MTDLELENIRYKYDLEPVLNDISIKFDKGCLYGILGPNGSGKTTLLNVISRILKKQYGSILMDGKDISKLSIRDMAKNIAYVRQTDTNTFDFTVYDVIMMGRYPYIDRFVQEKEEDRNIVEQIIKDFNLEHFKDKNYLKLSGGEQQKVKIARALAQQGKILLLDEPTSHLDIKFQLELMLNIKSLVEKGIIVIMVIHDINLAAQFCDKLILLKKGRIFAFGKVKDVITHDNIKKVYNIDVFINNSPYTNSVYITPIHNKQIVQQNGVGLKKSKIHVIAGGGTAVNLLPSLQNYEVSIGVLNVLDDDYKIAEDLDFSIVSEAPFSQISDKSYQKLKDCVNNTDIVILCSIPFGDSNLKNLEILKDLQKPILILENMPITERDFSNNKKATEIYEEIIKNPNVIMFQSVDELVEHLEKNYSK